MGRNSAEMALGCARIAMPSIPLIVAIGTIIVRNPTDPKVLVFETFVAFWIGAAFLFGGLAIFLWMAKSRGRDPQSN